MKHSLKMKEQLSKEPRYILYDFGIMMKDDRKVNKLAFSFSLKTFYAGFYLFDRVRVVRAFYFINLVKIKALSRKRSYNCNRVIRRSLLLASPASLAPSALTQSTCGKSAE